MENKRTVSILIPYKFVNDKCLVYLQKKSEDHETIPGFFAFWGGGMEENENPEQALIREIKEELGIELKEYKYFGRYEQKWIKNVFIVKVDDNFEDKINISEGDYGKWFSKEEALNETKFSEGDKIVLRDFYKNL